MKHTTFLFILTLFILACGRKIPQPLPPVATVPAVKDTLLSPSQYLSNRIPDCDKALVYMDSVIIPDKLYLTDNPYGLINGRVPNVVEGTFKIAGNTVNLTKNNKHLYYINKDCIIGRPSAEVFKLFFSEKYINVLNNIDSVKVLSDRSWRLHLREREGYGVTLDMKDRQIISCYSGQIIKMIQSH